MPILGLAGFGGGSAGFIGSNFLPGSINNPALTATVLLVAHK